MHLKTTVQKIGHSLWVIIPRELKAKVGDKYKVTKIGDTLIMTSQREDLFRNEADWTGFRNSISKEDHEWDEAED
ncbi:antitoxin MazE [Levilactobacillus cerevisiae]|nr:antitoxin MazE [Levilactobacillus cerevisiae]